MSHLYSIKGHGVGTVFGREEFPEKSLNSMEELSGHCETVISSSLQVIGVSYILNYFFIELISQSSQISLILSFVDDGWWK